MKVYLNSLLCLLVLAVFPLLAETNSENYSVITSESVVPVAKDPVKIQILHEEESIQPGRPFWVALHLDLENGWHSYWKNPGDAGMPTMVDWNLPEGFTASAINWPVPHRFSQDSLVGFGYEDEALLLVEITPPKTLALDQPIKLSADIRWLVCSDSTCLPGETHVESTFAVTSAAPQTKTASQPQFAKARSLLPQKNETIKAERKSDLIQLTVSNVNSNAITHAYFCPEENEVIDGTKEIVLSTTDAKELTLALRDKTDQNTHLKGVLVLVSNDKKLDAIELDLPIQNSDNTAVGLADAPVVKEQFTNDNEFDGGFGMALVLAFVGGMILNLMPCVLPVLSFKIMSFVKMAGQNRALTFKHGVAFSWGVLVSFWALAGALLILQAYGRSVGWGFQLQEPIFVAILAALLFVFGLSLFGVMELGTSITAWAGNSQSRSESLTSSFLSGVLATAVATPCTGPFLGSAVGYAVTLSAPLALLIFTAIGVGMAFPYLLLSAFPALLRFMPKPGNWMITFKEIMGFFMIATVLWLVWVFAAQTSNVALILLLASFFFLSIGTWIYGKWGSPVKSRTTRYISYAITSLLLITSGYTIWVASNMEDTTSTTEVASNWEEFNPQRIEELQKQGIPVFVDFTAKWCLICQTNHMVLETDNVSKKLDQMGVVRMKADWTKRDSMIAEELRKFGRNSVPLYVLYGHEAGEKPAVLPQVLTPDVIIDNLNFMK